jgi:hypothetical protein
VIDISLSSSSSLSLFSCLCCVRINVVQLNVSEVVWLSETGNT